MNASLVSLLPPCRIGHLTRSPADSKANPPKPKNFVSDGEVDQTIALLGGDAREVVRALLYALDNIVSRGHRDARGAP